MIDVVAINGVGGWSSALFDAAEEEIFPWGKSSTSHVVVSVCGLGALAFFSRKKKSSENGFEAEIPIETTQSPKRNSPPVSEKISRARLQLYRTFQPKQKILGEANLKLPSCSQEDRVKIGKVISILDDYPVLTIVSHVAELDQLKAEINHVHPLLFLATIFSDPILKKKIKRVFNDFWKYPYQVKFLEGVEKGIKRYTIQQLDPYLENWATLLHTKKDVVQPLIAGEKWKMLVLHLLNL